MEIKAKLIDFARVPCVMCFENFYMAETCIPNFQSFCPTYLFIYIYSRYQKGEESQSTEISMQI